MSYRCSGRRTRAGSRRATVSSTPRSTTSSTPLGRDNARAYVDKFRATRPTLVQTASPAYTIYEPWIQNSNWEFYDELLTWYDVAATTPWSLYWERRASPAPPPTLLATIPVAPKASYVDLSAVPVTTNAASVLEVEIEYEVSNPLRALPLIGANPRYLIGIGGAHNWTAGAGALRSFGAFSPLRVARTTPIASLSDRLTPAWCVIHAEGGAGLFSGHRPTKPNVAIADASEPLVDHERLNL